MAVTANMKLWRRFKYENIKLNSSYFHISRHSHHFCVFKAIYVLNGFKHLIYWPSLGHHWPSWPSLGHPILPLLTTPSYILLLPPLTPYLVGSLYNTLYYKTLKVFKNIYTHSIYNIYI